MESAALSRFMAKVEVNDEGCWIWTGARTKGGYGNFTLDARRASYRFVVAHRAAYEHFGGPIPTGLQLDHLCRVRHCVNPEHVEPVTNRENSQRGAKGRLITVCKRGHELTPENTMRRKEGRRRCRECARLASAAQNERSRRLGLRQYSPEMRERQNAKRREKRRAERQG